MTAASLTMLPKTTNPACLHAPLSVDGGARRQGPGWRQVALVVFATLLAPDLLRAQIDVINHRQWAWLMQRRRELQAVVQDLPAKRRAAVAAALVRCDESVPLLTWSRAMALAKDIKDDAPFRFRAGLQVFAMPEIVSSESFDHVAVTVYAPHVNLTGSLPRPKKFGFQVRVANAQGEPVWSGKIDEETSFRMLREYRITCKVPIGELAEGRYRVTVDAIMDGQPARAQDLALSTSFSVLHSYKQRGGFFRAEVPSAGVVAELGKLAPLPRAILRAAAEFAARPYYGMPGIDTARGVPDLLRAEAILKNLRADRPPLRGLQGYVDIALPRGEDGVVFATARLPKGGLPARGSEAWRSLARRPLVLFFSRRPTWDVRGRRPSHPRFALPCYLAAGLERAGFDGEGRFQVLVLESPGRVPSRTLSAALEQVSQVLPCDLQRCVLVGDGQGAGFAADLALADPARVAGLILFGNAGGLATPQLRKLRGVPIAAFKRHGDAPGADSIDLLRSCGETAGHTAGVAVDPVAAPLPWSLAVPLRAGWIGSFATRVTKR